MKSEIQFRIVIVLFLKNMFKSILAVLFLFPVFQVAVIAQAGGISFDANGTVKFLIEESGQNIALSDDRPFSFSVETNGKRQSYRVDKISTVSASAQKTVLLLTSSLLPGNSATVEVSEKTQSAIFTISRVSGSQISGVSLRFAMPDDFDCQIGNPTYLATGHSCSSVTRGTVAAFCLDGNCENTTQFDYPSLRGRLGTDILRSPLKDLAGSSFVIFSSPAHYQTLRFLRDFAAFRNRFGTPSTSASTIFYNDLPRGNCSEPLCDERVQAAAKIAKENGFDEAMLEGSIWQKTNGEFDARPDLRRAVNTFRSNGVSLMLHSLASEVTAYNRLCDPNPPAAGIDVRSFRCPNNSARVDRSGKTQINPYGTNYLWDGDQKQIFDRVVKSQVDGTLSVGAVGMYADGTDWFYQVHPLLASTYVAEFDKRAPNLRLRSSASGSPMALFVRSVDWTDRWQILNSRTPKDWTFNLGYETLQGWHERFGIGGRLGWVPPPRAQDRPEDYLPMLNAAVASGSFLTIQTDGDDEVWTSNTGGWFRTALRETLAAVKEIRSSGSEGMPAERTARYDLTHFSNGVSTVALFDSILPAGRNSKLDARTYGVRIDKGGACRNSGSCFYFKGTPRLPSAPDSPRLTDGGSFMFAPGNAATRTKTFTLAAWFKQERPNSTGVLFEKMTFGYGLYLANGEIGGHISGSTPGAFLNNPYFRLANQTSWNHFIYVYNDIDRRVWCYLNGKKVLDTNVSGSSPARIMANSPILVGTMSGEQTNFRGWMDDIELYDRDLTESEAASLYDSTATFGEPVISWIAATPAPRSPVLDLKLETQRIVYLVPMLEGDRLPSQKIKLFFDGFRGRSTAAKVQTSLKFKRTQPNPDTLVIEIDSAVIGDRPVRLAIT